MGPLIFLPLIFLVTITGSFGNGGFFGQCDISHCHAELPPDFMSHFPPNQERLEAVCPILLGSISCYSTEIPECTGQTIEELLASDNSTVVEFLTIFNNMRSLLRDLCDEDNDLSKNYKANAICLKENIDEHSMMCRMEGEKLYEAYIEKLTSLAEVNPDRPSSEVRCLSVSYEIACTMKAIQKNCGQVAKDTLQEIVRRVQMLKFGLCSESEILTLRGQFLDFLEEQGEERDFMSAVFEFRKRRK